MKFNDIHGIRTNKTVRFSALSGKYEVRKIEKRPFCIRCNHHHCIALPGDTCRPKYQTKSLTKQHKGKKHHMSSLSNENEDDEDIFMRSERVFRSF